MTRDCERLDIALYAWDLGPPSMDCVAKMQIHILFF